MKTVTKVIYIVFRQILTACYFLQRKQKQRSINKTFGKLSDFRELSSNYLQLHFLLIVWNNFETTCNQRDMYDVQECVLRVYLVKTLPDWHNQRQISQTSALIPSCLDACDHFKVYFMPATAFSQLRQLSIFFFILSSFITNLPSYQYNGLTQKSATLNTFFHLRREIKKSFYFFASLSCQLPFVLHLKHLSLTLFS